MLEKQIKEINIENFKCFESFSIKNLNKINIFFGNNDSGKTSILETIYITFSNLQPNNIFSILRNYPLSIIEENSDDIWNLLFFKFSIDKEIKLKAIFENDESVEVTLNKPFFYTKSSEAKTDFSRPIDPHSLLIFWKYKELSKTAIITLGQQKDLQQNISIPSLLSSEVKLIPSLLSSGGELNFTLKHFFYFTTKPIPFINFINKIYGDIVKENMKEEFLNALKEIRPEVKEIDMINFLGIQTVAVKFSHDKENFYPLSTMGEGFSKIFAIIGLIITNRNGVLLIDEIENGLYYRIQPIFWKYIEKFAIKLNVQLFITTHSYEFLSNFIESTKNINYISGYTLRKIENNIKCINLQGNELKEMVENNYEVR